MGRFISADWGGDPEPVPYADFSDPQTLNLYIYVSNNPLSATDEDGHQVAPDVNIPWWRKFLNLFGGPWQNAAPDFGPMLSGFSKGTANQGRAYGRTKYPNRPENQPLPINGSGEKTGDVLAFVAPFLIPGGEGEIAWSSKEVASAAEAIESGATLVKVSTKSQAEELFLRLFQGDGYRNSTGMTATESKSFFGQKSGTFHWDIGGIGHGPSNPHGLSDHLQIHTFTGQIVRIFFDSK